MYILVCLQCWKQKAFDNYWSKKGTNFGQDKTGINVETVQYSPVNLIGRDSTKSVHSTISSLLQSTVHYRDSNQIMIYIDCNRIKGSFDSLKYVHRTVEQKKLSVSRYSYVSPLQLMLREKRRHLNLEIS